MIENKVTHIHDVVWVRRQPDDWRKAKYRLTDIRGIHYSSLTGGVGKGTPRPFLFGYVRCDGMLEGEVAHSATHGPCPHDIKVCIVKKDNSGRVIAALQDEAGPKPPRRPFCSEDAIRIVGQHSSILGPELRELIEREGHTPMNISYVLPALVRRGQLVASREGQAIRYTVAKPEKARR